MTRNHVTAVRIHDHVESTSIVTHLRRAENGFIAAFQGREGDREPEFIGGTTGELKQAVMTEFERRLDVRIAEIKPEIPKEKS